MTRQEQIGPGFFFESGCSKIPDVIAKVAKCGLNPYGGRRRGAHIGLEPKPRGDLADHRERRVGVFARIEARKVRDEPLMQISLRHENEPVVRPGGSHALEAERSGHSEFERHIEATEIICAFA